MVLQMLNPSHCFLKSSCSGTFSSIGIMEALRSIETNAYCDIVSLDKLTPCIIYQCPIRLKSVSYLQPLQGGEPRKALVTLHNRK